MKKYLKIIIFFVFIGVFCFLGYQIYVRIKHKNEVTKNIKIIPNFDYQNINGSVFTNNNLKKDTPTLFIYFNTECEFCNEEAQMIYENIEKFDNFQLVFISFEKPELIKNFSIKYKLNTYANINFLSDTKVSFANTFDVRSLPCLVLYDKKQRLIEKIKGKTKTETLIKKLNKE